MGKTRVSLLAAMALSLMTGSALAANPFTDVPRDHWAYDAVEQLAADGIIEGYGDGTYRGNRSITRFEMAQMTAKAMARTASGADKALVDKLAVEFAEELNSLGVRVSELERNADKVKWEGMLRLRTTSQWHDDKGDVTKRKAHYMTLRLDPVMEIDKNITAHARIDYNVNAAADSNVTSDNWAATGAELIPSSGLQRLWVQYDKGHYQVLVGKIPYKTIADYGMIFDYNLSGLQVTAGKDVKATVTVGRNRRFDAVNDMQAVYANNPAATAGKYWGLEIYNDRQKRFTWGVAYHRWTNSDKLFEECGASALNIYEFGAGYRFDKNLALKGAFSWTNDPDMEHEPGNPPEPCSSVSKRAFSIELDYKEAKIKDKGSFGLFLAYRQLGHYAVMAPTYDLLGHGLRGVEAGADYVFAPNIMGSVRGFLGKKMPDETGPGEATETAKGFLADLKYFF